MNRLSTSSDVVRASVGAGSRNDEMHQRGSAVHEELDLLLTRHFGKLTEYLDVWMSRQEMLANRQLNSARAVVENHRLRPSDIVSSRVSPISRETMKNRTSAQEDDHWTKTILNLFKVPPTKAGNTKGGAKSLSSDVSNLTLGSYYVNSTPNTDSNLRRSHQSEATDASSHATFRSAHRRMSPNRYESQQVGYALQNERVSDVSVRFPSQSIEVDAVGQEKSLAQSSNLDWVVDQATTLSTDRDRSRYNKADLIAAEDARISELTNSTKKPFFGFRRPYRIVNHRLFEPFFAGTIITNSIVIGLQVELVARQPEMESSTEFFVIQNVYATAFFVELVMRVLASGRLFFYHNDLSNLFWNYLDLFVVLSSLVELVLDIMRLSADEDPVDDGPDGSQGVSNVRIIRLIRITRLVRVIRVLKIVRFVRALRTLVYSILCTLRSLFWAMLLLVMIFYLFGILFTQAASDHLKVHGQESFSGGRAMAFYWASLPKSMYTLFKVVTGGVTWEVAAAPLSDIDGIWLVIFIIFVTFALFAVLNVITGVFCQSAIEGAQNDYELVVQSHLANRRMYCGKIRQLFADIDLDGSGTINVNEFEMHLKNEKVKAYFASLELDIEDAWALFKLLDTDDSNVIDLEEFLMGCMRLKGSAKAIEVAKLTYDQKQMRKRLHSFTSYVELALAALCADHALAIPRPPGVKRVMTQLEHRRASGTTTESSEPYSMSSTQAFGLIPPSDLTVRNSHNWQPVDSESRSDHNFGICWSVPEVKIDGSSPSDFSEATTNE